MKDAPYPEWPHLQQCFARDESHNESMSDAFVADLGRCNSIRDKFNTFVEASNETTQSTARQGEPRAFRSSLFLVENNPPCKDGDAKHHGIWEAEQHLLLHEPTGSQEMTEVCSSMRAKCASDNIHDTTGKGEFVTASHQWRHPSPLGIRGSDLFPYINAGEK